MRYVYGGSYINIAATEATNAHQGCFKEPEHHTNGLIVRITTSEHCRIHTFYSEYDRKKAIATSALANRAWAFQKRLLSQEHCIATRVGYSGNADPRRGPNSFPKRIYTCQNHYLYVQRTHLGPGTV